MRVTEETFTTALQAASHTQTAQTLGDRSTYIGASDIGQCPRKVILGKVVPTQHSLKTLLHFKRGHLTEEIVAEVLQDFVPERQKAVCESIPYCSLCEFISLEGSANQVSPNCPRCQEPMSLLPVAAHIDFLLPGNRIIEVKSTSLTEVLAAWETQLVFQMMLLQRETRRHVEGALLLIDIGKAEMRAFNGYAYSPDRDRELLAKAVAIWEGVQAASRSEAPELLNLQCEPSILCGYCSYLVSCPAHAGPELPQEVSTLLEQYHQATEAEKAAKAVRETLRDHVLTLLKPGKYQAGNLRVSLSSRSRTSTDMKAITALLGELGQSIEDYQSQSAYQVLDVRAA
jgi:CRISPR-associated exonuclease Cas4